MRKATKMTLEITGYLILSCAVTIIATMIWQRITQEPREDVADTIRWALTLNLLFCALPTMLPFCSFPPNKAERDSF